MERSTSKQDSIPPIYDDDSWEDTSDQASPTETTLRAPSPATSSSVRSRKRKAVYRSVHVSTSPRKAYPRQATPKPEVPNQEAPTLPKPSRIPAINQEEWLEGLYDAVVFVFRYARDVLSQSIHLLRKPLSVLIFLWLLSFIISRLSHTIRAAFSPLCIIPGISRSTLCIPNVPNIPRSQEKDKNPPRWADYPKLVDVQSTTFSQLLDQVMGGSGLSLEIKKAEIATGDLVTLVRYSDLTSRESLADSLAEFVQDARKAGKSLQKLSSKVGGAVDGILAVNDYALHTIEDAYSKSSSSSSLRALVPWSSGPKTEEVVTKTFTETMNFLSSTMKRLLIEAHVSLDNLNKLEERLSTLHVAVSHEDSSISSAKSELLSELWTKVGGNRHTLKGYDNHLKLLKNLGSYRKRALAHVVAALQTLGTMSEDMQDLSERVSSPELIGSKIPVEVHMKSIRGGLERLKEGRLIAKDREAEAVKRVIDAE